MRAGPLDRRITLQRMVVEQSESGQENVTWQDMATVWAQKVENRGAERFAAQQITGRAIRTFRFRWQTDLEHLNTKDQVVYAETAYDITDVREIGRHEGIEIDCYSPSDQIVTTP
jgi:SPP1 family predicted phage head-tail adaptor